MAAAAITSSNTKLDSTVDDGQSDTFKQEKKAQAPDRSMPDRVSRTRVASSGCNTSDMLSEERFDILLDHLKRIDGRLLRLEESVKAASPTTPFRSMDTAPPRTMAMPSAMVAALMPTAAAAPSGSDHARAPAAAMPAGPSGPWRPRLRSDADDRPEECVASATSSWVENGWAFAHSAEHVASSERSRNAMDALVSHLDARHARHELAQMGGRTQAKTLWSRLIHRMGVGPEWSVFPKGGGMSTFNYLVSKLPRVHPAGTLRLRWELANFVMLSACVILIPLRLAYTSWRLASEELLLAIECADKLDPSHHAATPASDRCTAVNGRC
jgi:hypothetical protein